MPAPDALDTLRRHDPAAVLPPAEADARERLRRAIVATPVQREPRRLLRSRWRVALVAAVVALVVAAGGWGLRSSVLETAQTVRDDFDDVTATIPLPPGAAWSDPNLDADDWYGEQMGLFIAQHQATCAWFEYWNEGDAAQRAEATRGFERVRATMFPRRDDAFEDEAGYSGSMLRFYDSLLADMRRGEPTEIRRYLRANC
jgi:hypothetical protein